MHDSKRYLENFINMGIARSLKAYDGSVVYHFTEVLTDTEKGMAESI